MYNYWYIIMQLYLCWQWIKVLDFSLKCFNWPLLFSCIYLCGDVFMRRWESIFQGVISLLFTMSLGVTLRSLGLSIKGWIFLTVQDPRLPTQLLKWDTFRPSVCFIKGLSKKLILGWKVEKGCWRIFITYSEVILSRNNIKLSVKNMGGSMSFSLPISL